MCNIRHLDWELGVKVCTFLSVVRQLPKIWKTLFLPESSLLSGKTAKLIWTWKSVKVESLQIRIVQCKVCRDRGLGAEQDRVISCWYSRGRKGVFPTFCEHVNNVYKGINVVIKIWKRVDTKWIPRPNRRRCTFQISTTHSRYIGNLGMGITRKIVKNVRWILTYWPIEFINANELHTKDGSARILYERQSMRFSEALIFFKMYSSENNIRNIIYLRIEYIQPERHIFIWQILIGIFYDMIYISLVASW